MGMEDETRNFLVLILNTISLVLIWMIANVFIGIYLNLGFFETTPTWKNYVYYFFFLSTLVWLFIYLRRKWKL
jgi:hypothetical protein